MGESRHLPASALAAAVLQREDRATATHMCPVAAMTPDSTRAARDLFKIVMSARTS